MTISEGNDGAAMDVDWLTARLPPKEPISSYNEPDYYGASHVIARQIGWKGPLPTTATWSHGWHYLEPTHVKQLAQTGGPGDVHLVARERFAQFLRERGYSRTYAVGLPFIYGDAPPVERRCGSLLVMPAHSLAATKHAWKQDEYAEDIARIRADFSSIVVCVSQSCVQAGYWTKAFERVGIPWIAGASLSDRNSLVRIKTMLSSFEYVTTNAIGSHVAYAAYAGCKVSIYGTYAEFRPEDYQDEPAYKATPELLSIHLAGMSEPNVRAHYPELFSSPHEAAIRVDWARAMMGEENRRSPEEIARLLGWSWWMHARREARDWTRQRMWDALKVTRPFRHRYGLYRRGGADGK